MEGQLPKVHCESKRTLQLLSWVLTSMLSLVQDIMPRIMQFILFALFVHAVSGSSPKESKAAHKFVQDASLGRVSGATHEPNVLYLFPNGTAKEEKAFLSVYKHFEDTHAPQQRNLLERAFCMSCFLLGLITSCTRIFSRRRQRAAAGRLEMLIRLSHIIHKGLDGFDPVGQAIAF